MAYVKATNYSEILSGSSVADLIEGLEGNDTLYGGSGADKFIFYANDGQDKVLDFANGTDLIRIWAPGEVTSFSDVTVSAYGSGTQLDFASTTVVLSNVNPGLIDASDFLFT